MIRFGGHYYALPAGQHVTEFLFERFGLKREHFWIANRASENADSTFDIRLRLVGGKGGFGSQLRAQGNRMSSRKRAGNYEACRDLSGRRLRSVKEAQIISDYVKRKPELDAKKAEAIKERMEKAIEAGTSRKTVFEDVDFLKAARDVVDEVELAVNEAIYGYEGETETEGEEDYTKGKEKVVT